MPVPSTPRSLRQRIADWPPLTNAVAALLAGYIRLVRTTAHWDEQGYDAVRAAIAEHGAAIIVFWHQRTFAAPFILDPAHAPVQGLTANSRPGRLAAAMLRVFGFRMTPMPKGRGARHALRTVLRGLADGASVGIAVDGPRGPARQAKSYPLQWARVSGKPIILFTFAAKHYVTWPSWDRLILPLPFTRIQLRWAIWDGAKPDRLDEAAMHALLNQLNTALDHLTDETDAGMGPRNIAHARARG